MTVVVFYLESNKVKNSMSSWINWHRGQTIINTYVWIKLLSFLSVGVCVLAQSCVSKRTTIQWALISVWCFLLPLDHMSLGGFKNGASSREQRPKYVHACVHIDFPTRLFTAKAKLWLERKGEQAKKNDRARQRELYIWTSGEVARKHKYAEKERHKHIHM